MQRYMTQGISESIYPILQSAMWDALDRIDKEVDYLQIFNLKSYGNLTIIDHHQEQPKYQSTVYVPDFTVDREIKVYIVIEDTIATMMLSEEY